jgi:hypothetical protein
MFKYFVFWAKYTYLNLDASHFCVANNIKNFVIKFCILVSDIINYAHIYFHKFFET